jgi:hypothetical protein
MTAEPPAYPYADCPTCHRHHSAALLPGESTKILCDCGKLLLIEKSAYGNSLVVREQIQPLVAVSPEAPAEVTNQPVEEPAETP